MGNIIGVEAEDARIRVRFATNGALVVWFLEHIPTRSSVKAVPIAEREPGVHYDIETPRYLAIVTPGGMDKVPSATPSNGRPRRIDRDDATRLRRVRAAHRQPPPAR